MFTTKILTTAVVLAAAAAPAASARPARDPIAVRPQPVQIVQAPAAHNGFDWGDAGIGAAGALALGLLGGFAGTRRTSRQRVSPAS